MRDKIKALYYPDFASDNITLVKAILLFDEIHFMDRPSFTFYLGSNDFTEKPSGFGLIGADSPLRQYEASFRNHGVPLYVHEAPGGPIYGDLLESVTADVTDRQFLSRFQDGLRTSDRFLDLHIPNGKYAGGETQDSIAKKLASIDLEKYTSPLDVYLDPNLMPFEYSTPEHCLKDLVAGAIHCSAKMNFALTVSAKYGFSPLADASPFNELLSAKYRRALSAVSEKTMVAVPATDLSLAILDELVPSESLFHLNLGDVIKYRRDSERAREAFLEHLAALQPKLSVVPADGDYGKAIKNLIDTDIRPAATNFRNQMTAVHEKLFGSIAKGVVAGAPVADAHFLGDLSWPILLGMAGVAGVYTPHQTIDAALESRKVRRECAISYLLDVGKNR
jgi:hypothetical protein